MPRANVAVATATRMTYAEYLAAEADAENKHEYLHGEVWAMAGGTPEHGAISATLIMLLGNALQSKPCRVLTSDVRVRVLATDLSTYPDVSVVCGRVERAPDDQNAVTHAVNRRTQVLIDGADLFKMRQPRLLLNILHVPVNCLTKANY